MGEFWPWVYEGKWSGHFYHCFTGVSKNIQGLGVNYICQRGGWIFSIPAVWVRSFDPQSINFGTLNVIQTKTCLYTNIDYIVWILSEKKRCFDTVFWYSSNVAGLKNSIKSSFKAGTWSIHNVFEYNYIIHMCYHVFEMIYKPLFFWHREVRTGMEMIMAFFNGCIITIYRRSRCCKHHNFGGVLVAVYWNF